MNVRLSLVLAAAACSACTQTPTPATPGIDAGAGDGSPPPDGTVTSADPAGDGTFAVTEMTVSIPGSAAGRTLPATVFTPGGGSARPLVIVSPGFQMQRRQYASYARHLATWGFVAVLTDYADTGFFADHQGLADDVTAAIDWALAAELDVDAAKIAAVGHSLGGKISVFAATQDTRIAAVVGWDPVDSNNPSVVPQKMATMSAALAVIGETTNASGGGMPCAPAADNYAQFYAAATGPAAIKITVNGADHMDWVDDPSCGFCGFCSPGTADAEVARTVSRRVNVAWLRRQLLSDAAMDSWLDSPPELGDGLVAIERR